jgi:aspartyl-tRNA(Asn)/glutamyl-tRNA(Gln) amidotransferase subunit B
MKMLHSTIRMTRHYEAVIGLECHAQLLTNSKLFCSCSTKFGEAPNMNTCPVCLGLPGALPVLNRVAVALAVRAALGLNCRLNPESQWARKNYFYPDLPKGYQISQYDRPLAQHGHIEISLDGVKKRIGVQRIHMEEDAGKSLHEGFADSSRNTYLDFNRSGVPLIEIVTDPDIRSSAEANDYLKRLKEILEYLDVNDGNMEEGSLRCDANVSVRPVGEQKLGTRTELKNINSFRFVQKAIDYEISRQIDVIESAEKLCRKRVFGTATKSGRSPCAARKKLTTIGISPIPICRSSRSIANGSSRSKNPCRNSPSLDVRVSCRNMGSPTTMPVFWRPRARWRISLRKQRS